MTDHNAWVRDGFRRRQTSKVILLSLASLLIRGSASWAQPMNVRDVINGDTIVVDHNRLIRLIGIGAVGHSQANYVARKGSRTYHKISCLLARKIPLEERVTFHKEEEAIKRGYRKDRWCDPILEKRF